MAKFAFIVPPLSGHINPTLSLGTELLKRNHEVSWISFDPSLKEQLPDGGKLLLISVDLTKEEKEKLEKYIDELRKKSTHGIESLKFLYDEVLIPMNTYILDGISQILTEYSPDIVLTDHQVFAGAVASIQKGIPYVTSVTAPASIKPSETLPMIYQWESEQVISFQKKFGISEDERLDCSKLLTLVYTSKLFFGKNDMPSYFKFVGPTLLPRAKKIDFDWEKFFSMGDNPKILVSIGTTFDHSQKQAFFEKIIEALQNEKLSVILISDPDLFENIPDNFIIQKEIPQLELIPYMQMVICHGGHNTVCETISQGIPLIVLPIAYDQSYVASCVADNHAGIRLKFNRFKASHLKEAVYSVLNNPDYKSGAKKIQKSFEEAGGVFKAADYLEDIIK